MSLSDVPEEGSPTSPRPFPSLRTPRKSSSLRPLTERPSRSNLHPPAPPPPASTNSHISIPSISGSLPVPPNPDLRASKRTASTSSLNAVTAHKSSSSHRPDRDKAAPPSVPPTQPKPRTTPRLPHDIDIEPSPATVMYWSRAPVYGAVPNRGMRAHSVTIVDTVAWVFGGCDDKDCWKDVYCFDTGTAHFLILS